MKKALIKTVSTLAPGLVVNFAYNQLVNPQIKKLREHELAVLDLSRKDRFAFEGFEIQRYHWSGSGPTVLLVHGWEGQAGNFAELITRLQNQNYNIVAFDGPSHGYSSRGETSLFEFAELVAYILREEQADLLVSHSFGGVATTYGLSQHPEIKIRKYALLTTPDRFTERVDQVARQVGITQKVKQRLIRKVEAEIDLEADTLNVSDFVRQVSVREALIIHDKADKVIPIDQSRRVKAQWPAARMIEIEGTGHFRILRTTAVHDQVLSFLEA